MVEGNTGRRRAVLDEALLQHLEGGGVAARLHPLELDGHHVRRLAELVEVRLSVATQVSASDVRSWNTAAASNWERVNIARCHSRVVA